MSRRALLTATLAGLVPSFALARDAWRIGVLTFGVAPKSRLLDSFRQAMLEHGYAEGKNVAYEYRYAEGQANVLPRLAAELIATRVDLIVTESTPAALAVKKASQTVPVVMALSADPVSLGVVPSLRRPGGNITGMTLAGSDRTQKQLQFLKEILPAKPGLVAIIHNDSRPDYAKEQVAEVQSARQLLGLEVQFFPVRSPQDLDGAFEAVLRAKPTALVTLGDGMLLGSRSRIVEFAAQHRLPGIFPEREFAEAGGLLSFGPNITANFQRAAAYVDKILKGASPGELPIEQPTKFELVINLRAARELGVKIPQSLLVRADDVLN